MVNISAVERGSAKDVKNVLVDAKPSFMDKVKGVYDKVEMKVGHKVNIGVLAAMMVAAPLVQSCNKDGSPWGTDRYDINANQTTGSVSQSVNVDFSALAGLLTQLLEQQNNLSENQTAILLQILQTLNDLNNTTGNINTQLTGMNQQLAQIIAALSLVMANQNTIIGNQNQQIANQTTIIMLLQMMDGNLTDKLAAITAALHELHSDNNGIGAKIDQMSESIRMLLQQGNALLQQGNTTAQAQYDAFNQMATQLVVAFATITSQFDNVIDNQQTDMALANQRFTTLMNMIEAIKNMLADNNSLLNAGNALGAQGVAGINAIYDLVSVFSANVASFDQSVLQKLQLIITKLNQTHGYLASINGNTAASAHSTACIANLVSSLLPYVQNIDANTQNIDYNNATLQQLLTALFANIADRLDNMDGHLLDINGTLVTIDGHTVDLEAAVLAAMQNLANDINTNNNNNNAALIDVESAFLNQILANQGTAIGNQGAMISLLNQGNAIANATKQFLAGGLNMIMNSINANTGAVNANTAAVNSFKMMFYNMALNIADKIDNFANMNASQQAQIIALLEDYMPLMQDIYDGIAQGNLTSQLIYNETQSINNSINVLGVPLQQLLGQSFFISGQLGMINGHLGDISGQLVNGNATLAQILEQTTGINVNTSTMAQHLGQINSTTGLIYNQQLSQAEWNEVAKAEILEAMGAIIQLQAAGNEISGVTNQKLDAMTGLVNYIKNHMNDGAYYAGQQVSGTLCMFLNALPQYTNAILASINKLNGDVVNQLVTLGEKIDFNNTQNGQMISQATLSNKIAADNRALITQILNLARNNAAINQSQLNTIIGYLANLANEGQDISDQIANIINMLPGLTSSVTTAIDASTGQVVAAIDQNTQAANANAIAIINAMPDNQQVVYMLGCVKAAIEALEMQVTVNVENNNTNINENNVDVEVLVELINEIMPGNPDLTPILNAVNQLNNSIQQGNITASQIHSTELDILHSLQQNLPAIYQRFDDVITAINNNSCNCTPAEMHDYTVQLQTIINLIQQLVNQGVSNNENIQDISLEDLIGGWGGDLKSLKVYLTKNNVSTIANKFNISKNQAIVAKLKAHGSAIESTGKKIFKSRTSRRNLPAMRLSGKKALVRNSKYFSPKGYYQGLVEQGIARRTSNGTYIIDKNRMTGYFIGKLKADKGSVSKFQGLLDAKLGNQNNDVKIPAVGTDDVRKPAEINDAVRKPAEGVRTISPENSTSKKAPSADMKAKAYSAVINSVRPSEGSIYVPDEYVAVFARMADNENAALLS